MTVFNLHGFGVEHILILFLNVVQFALQSINVLFLSDFNLLANFTLSVQLTVEIFAGSLRVVDLILHFEDLFFEHNDLPFDSVVLDFHVLSRKLRIFQRSNY